MPVIILQQGEWYVQEEVRVPAWVADLESFLRWTESDDFPEKGRFDYLQGEVWIDLSKEQVFTHNQAKMAFILALGGLARAEELGHYFMNGVQLSSASADLACMPDGVFVCGATLGTGKVLLTDARIEGTPDMALEVVSDNSVRKDTDVLKRAYWDAGIKEYWLVDVRGERLSFDIFRHTDKGYVATRKKDGWLKSQVFGKSFRLTRQADEFGNPDYTLEVR